MNNADPHAPENAVSSNGGRRWPKDDYVDEQVVRFDKHYDLANQSTRPLINLLGDAASSLDVEQLQQYCDRTVGMEAACRKLYLDVLGVTN